MVNLNFYRLMSKGLIVAQDVVHNPEGMQAYYERTPAVIEHFGGRVIAFTTDADCREGDGFPVWAVLEFPSLDAARSYYNPEDYQQNCKPLRLPHSTFSVSLLEGV